MANEDHLVSILGGLQTNNRAILGQLTRLAEAVDAHCSCTCHNPGANVQVSTEIRDLKKRIRLLEEIVLKGSDYKNDGQSSIPSGSSVQAKRDEIQLGVENSAHGLKEAHTTQTVSNDSVSLNTERQTLREVSLPNANVGTKKEHKAVKFSNVPQVSAVKPQSHNALSHMQLEGILRKSGSEMGQSRDATQNTSDTTAIPKSNIRAVKEIPVSVNPGKSPPQSLDVEVIHQKEVRCLSGDSTWEAIAQLAVECGRFMPDVVQLEGAHTALLLDISESMAEGTALLQAKTFLDDYLNGLAKVSQESHGLVTEHVAFVTFGHETRIVRHLTSDYDGIRRDIGAIRLGGPSPIVGGILMALASVMSCKSFIHIINDILVPSKIVVVSDGHVTDTQQVSGPDSTGPIQGLHIEDIEDTIARQIRQRDIDIYFVPVGNANEGMVERVLTGLCRMWHWDQGDKLSRQNILTTIVAPTLSRGFPVVELNPNFSTTVALSDSDRVQISQIVMDINDRRLHQLSRQNNRQDDPYYDCDNDRLLAVGTRVRRGPDWNSVINEDNNGPGTVVGHCRMGDGVFVEWDNEATRKIGRYRYGDENCYDVLPVDDIRTPSPDGSLGVGCLVKPGRDASDNHPQLGSFERGVVTFLTRNHTVGVKWFSGARGEYDFIPGIREEVEFCPPGEENAPVNVVVEEKKSQVKKNKNKNK